MAEHIRNNGRKKARKQPISRHPLFPATVALWFAALFGLGSLIIRPALLESVVLALSLDSVIPAAAPPLGVTARMLLALAMTAVGGVAGLIIALRIPRSGNRGARRKQDDGDAQADSADENPLWSDLRKRRRAIAVGQEEPLSEPDTTAFEAEADTRGEDEAVEAAESVIAGEAPAERRTPALLKAPTVSAADRIASAELCELSHVELLERLALSLEKRRGRPRPATTDTRIEAETEIASAAPPQTPKPFEPVRIELPRFISTSPLPSFTEADEDWEDASPLPPRFLPSPSAGTAWDEDEWGDTAEDSAGDDDVGEDEDKAEDGYSSLLNLGMRTYSQPADHLDGNAVIAPRPFAEIQPQGPEETERALRAALATLQRMSGAA